MAAAAPAQAASGNFALVVTEPIAGFGDCAKNTNGILTLTNNGTPAAGVVVNVTLPDELIWVGSTSSQTKAFTTDANGRILLADAIHSTGTAGTFTITAESSTTPAAQATLTVTVTGTDGVIYYTADQHNAVSSDPNGTVDDARDIVVVTNYVYVITSSGKWYVKAGADAVNPYKLISAPTIDSVWGGLGSDYGYALSGGKVYRSAATTTSSLVTGVTGVVELATTGGRVFARTSGGDVYRAVDGGNFTQVTINGTSTALTNVSAIAGNQGGGYGWAISGTDIYYILDNNLAYLATNTSAKPSAPKALAIGASYAYTLDADGSVWSHYAAAPGNWTKMTGLPGGATKIASNLGGNYIWALSGATPYYSGNAASFSGTSAPGAVAGNSAQLWVGANYGYVRTTSGQWWQTTGSTWSQIVGTPGNTVRKIATNYGDYAWAIANRNSVCEI